MNRGIRELRGKAKVQQPVLRPSSYYEERVKAVVLFSSFFFSSHQLKPKKQAPWPASRAPFVWSSLFYKFHGGLGNSFLSVFFSSLHIPRLVSLRASGSDFGLRVDLLFARVH
jgi:hypothetical protein